MNTDRDTYVFWRRLVSNGTLLIVFAAGLLIALPRNGWAQVPAKPAAAADDPAGELEALRQAENGQRAAQSNGMLDEINALRREMGGGVASQLEGLYDDSEDGRRQLQRAFDRGINGLMGTQRPASAVPLASSGGAVARVCASLRKAARELDATAADLEDAELYTEADMVRSSAGNLRCRARAVAPSWAEKAAQPGFCLPSMGFADEALGGSGLPTKGADPKIRPRQ